MAAATVVDISSKPEATGRQSLTISTGGILRRHIWRLLACLAAVASLTVLGHQVISVNSTTAGFAYLMLVLIVASTWGFFGSRTIVPRRYSRFQPLLLSSDWNLYHCRPAELGGPVQLSGNFPDRQPPVDHSRRRRALDALERQQDIERLYTFSRAILLTSRDEPFPNQLIRKLAEIFGFNAAVLYDRRTGEFYRAGPADFDGTRRSASGRRLAWHVFHRRMPPPDPITAVRLGSEPIASLALQGVQYAGFRSPGHRQSGGHRARTGKGAGSCPSGRSGAAKRTTPHHPDRCHGA